MNKTGLFRRRRDEDVPGYIKKKSMTKSQSKKKEEYDRERCYHHYGQRNDSGTDQCIRWTESRHGVATRSYPPAIWGSGICGHPCHDVRRLVVHTQTRWFSIVAVFRASGRWEFLSTRNWKCKVEWSISVPPRVEEKTKRVGCHQQKRRNRNIEMDTKNATISPREPAQRSLKRYLPFHFSIFMFWIHCEKKNYE